MKKSISFFRVIATLSFLLTFQIQFASAQSLSQTPPMGWNSWNAFHTDISEQKIKDAAQAMVSSGMKAAGYEYGKQQNSFIYEYGSRSWRRFRPV